MKNYSNYYCPLYIICGCHNNFQLYSSCHRFSSSTYFSLFFFSVALSPFLTFSIFCHNLRHFSFRFTIYNELLSSLFLSSPNFTHTHTQFSRSLSFPFAPVASQHSFANCVGFCFVWFLVKHNKVFVLTSKITRVWAARKTAIELKLPEICGVECSFMSRDIWNDKH